MRIEPFYSNIGGAIRRLRNAAGISQADLGSQLDPQLTRASIANIEAGKQRILAHTLVQIARALDVTIAQIVESAECRPSVDVIDITGEILMAAGIDAKVAADITRSMSVGQRRGSRGAP